MLLDTAAKLGRRPLEGTDPLADAGTLHAVLRRELCARFNVDHDEHVRQEEAAFVPFLQRLLQSNRAFRYTVVVAVTAPPRAPLGLSSSPLLGVATQALAAEAQPWSLPTVQGLLGAGHLFANIVQLERTYEMQLRKSSGEFDGRTLTDDRHRGAGASARCLAPRLSRCRLTVRARIARACAAGGGTAQRRRASSRTCRGRPCRCPSRRRRETSRPCSTAPANLYVSAPDWLRAQRDPVWLTRWGLRAIAMYARRQGSMAATPLTARSMLGYRVATESVPARLQLVLEGLVRPDARGATKG